MTMFEYRGVIPSSKSILNRLLILQSFAPHLSIRGDTNADDVVKMRAALAAIAQAQPADCGAAGTTLRFLALRASRSPGRHRLTGSRRLFERPQTEIKNVLAQLGCSVKIGATELIIEGDGWQTPHDGVKIDRSISSQFSSALLLSAWDLSQDLLVRFSGDAVSEGYFAMTVELAIRAGMKLRRDDGAVRIFAGSQIAAAKLDAEIDLSSAFAVAAVAVARRGQATFLHWPEASLQPDSVFPTILQKMGCHVLRDPSEGTLSISAVGVESLQAVQCDLRDAPDLFPVLSVLCALAKGESVLMGAPHLVHKESSRVEKSAEILQLMGAETTIRSDGMRICGLGTKNQSGQPRSADYDPAHDHRLAMAAAVARAAGYSIDILRPEVVNKSFPDFWTTLAAAGFEAL